MCAGFLADYGFGAALCGLGSAEFEGEVEGEQLDGLGHGEGLVSGGYGGGEDGVFGGAGDGDEED